MHRPSVFVVGTSDVHARIDLMRHLEDEFRVSAAGTSEGSRSRLAGAGYHFARYRLSRRPDPISDACAVAQLVHLFRQSRPHVVHTFDTKPGVWARLAARRASVPVVIGTLPGIGSLYTDSSISTRLIRAVYEPLQRMACHRADLTIFQNGDDEQQFADAGIVPVGRATVIRGSGIDTSRWSLAATPELSVRAFRQAAGLVPGTVAVTMVTRVYRSKGVLEFCSAAQELKAAGRLDARFTLVGGVDPDARDGLTPTDLRRVGETVCWLGERSDIASVLAGSDICVLPTYYREGIPRVLLEAACMGLPLVAADVPGCREVVRPGLNGFLVPPRDASALAEAIGTLVASRQMRNQFGEASRRIAEAEFDLNIVARQIADLYWELLDRKLGWHRPTTA